MVSTVCSELDDKKLKGTLREAASWVCSIGMGGGVGEEHTHKKHTHS